MQKFRLPFALLAAALVALVPGSALADTVAEGHARVVPVAAEFPTVGTPSIVHANVEIRDTGSTDVVHGEARGMDPSMTYISLVYSTPATGSTACLPGQPLSFQQMYLGVWTVDEEGHGKLRAVKSHTGNTSPTPPVFQTFLAAVTNGALGDLSTGDTYVALGSNTTSVSVREFLPGALQFAGLMLPQRIACGPLNVEAED